MKPTHTWRSWGNPLWSAGRPRTCTPFRPLQPQKVKSSSLSKSRLPGIHYRTLFVIVICHNIKPIDLSDINCTELSSRQCVRTESLFCQKTCSLRYCKMSQIIRQHSLVAEWVVSRVIILLFWPHFVRFRHKTTWLLISKTNKQINKTLQLIFVFFLIWMEVCAVVFYLFLSIFFFFGMI